MKLYSCEETWSVLEEILDIDTSLRGLSYLEKISHNIYKYFNLEYIIIGKAVGPQHKEAETIIALANGEMIENFTYELQNSPCENVFQSRNLCVYESNVVKDFDKHGLITDLGIESYLGSPLIQDDAIFGLLVFLDTKAIDYPEYYRSLVRILASRISVEIERYKNDQIVLSLQKSNVALSAKNQTDVLTGAYNRDFFFSQAGKLLNEGRTGALLFLDLDDFKFINDTYGHQAGDHILQSFATVVFNEIRKEDVFARYGGEEFVLFLPDANKEITLSITQRIHDSLKSIEAITYNLTASIGVYIVEEKYKNLECSIKNADMALYEAKSLGKNRTVFSKV
ncbi:MAG: sensor domain-containing diguanylate cyclase [Sulfuricurvum sp.]